jgi:hypothetical protein
MYLSEPTTGLVVGVEAEESAIRVQGEGRNWAQGSSCKQGRAGLVNAANLKARMYWWRQVIKEKQCWRWEMSKGWARGEGSLLGEGPKSPRSRTSCQIHQSEGRDLGTGTHLAWGVKSHTSYQIHQSEGRDLGTHLAQNLEASDHALAARSTNQRVVIWEQVHTLIHQ